MEPVTVPASTPQEATPKQASEALKQGGDVTKKDEGGQIVGVSAGKRSARTHAHRYMYF